MDLEAAVEGTQFFNKFNKSTGKVHPIRHKLPIKKKAIRQPVRGTPVLLMRRNSSSVTNMMHVC
jgi:hypothetical protein